MLVDMVDQITFQETLSGALTSVEDGTYPVTLLTPGMGTSAFYSESVVARDAPTAFPKGTHVYLMHAREDNGEPNPEKLLGVLTEDTKIRESDGAAVNRFKPMSRWAQFVDDVHPHVGLSIKAGGTATTGVVDGRTVRMAESIEYAIWNSVDVVSYPGRKGSGFVESAFAKYAEGVQTEPSAPGIQENGNKMAITEEQFTELSDTVKSLVTLVEAALPKAPEAKELDAEKAIADAVAATRLVESAEVPASVKTKLIEGIKAGNCDVEDEIKSVVDLQESIRTEVEAKFNESHALIGAAGAAGAGAVTVSGWSA